jgi:predicted flap endonuclease-1-like 5' DNA nuclease
MNPVLAFIIGLLVGWVIEWIIDWLYWRRKKIVEQPNELEEARSRAAALEQEIASYKNQLDNLQEERARSAVAPVVKAAPVPVPAPAAETLQVMEQAPVHDPLGEIPGVTPGMVNRLNETGISTFADLGALSPRELKELVGEQMLQPGSEVEIIQQARLSSGMIKKVDDLEIIVGIGPVIAKTLQYAGIFTFAQLAALSMDDLKAIVGARIERLADEEKILAQAQKLADEQDQVG